MLPFAAALAGCEGFPGVPACADDEACGAGARCDLETGRCVAAPSPRPEAGAGTDAAGSDAARSLPDARPEADAAMPDSAEDAAPADPDAAPAGSDAAPDAGSDATPDAGSDAAPPDAAPDACAPAPEICNGLDDDCDDAADEEAAGVGSECLTDGLGACAAGLRRCQPEQGLVCEPINVPAEEVCDGLDNDCDGETDEALAERCYPGDEATADVGLCRRGERRCEGARWTDCEGAVTPAEEICDGLDDDCDGETDEADPALCGECAVPGAAGACVRGVGVCREGAIVCARWPGLRAEGTCDLADDDCDGAVDEDGEVPVEPDADAVEACGPPGGDPLAAAPADDPVCQGDEAGLYGCGAVHACLDPICLGGCAVTEARSVEACAADCGGDDRCVWGCHGEAAAAARACRADCPPPDEGTTRWSCAPGDGCAPAVCADGWRLRDGRCVRPEICNNGLDDDGDGLVDGVVDPTFFGPDHCMVRLATEGTETTIALCPPGADDADCDNGPEEGNDDEYCAEGHCPQRARFSYDYALDHEEVSIRAYHECVRTGCCRPPVDARYRLAAGALDSGSAPPRPTEPNGCEPAPAIDPTDPPDSIADLPVTGVTWCEARDFCLWAGKRLPTETEWERGATGASPGRLRNGFGSRRPARCWEEACCAGPDFDGVVPDSCEPASRVVLCPAGTVEPDGIRPACVGTYDQFNSQCASLREDCFACIRGPAPAYGNEDGQTREGILNMGGNVTEWAFDWYREQRANPIDDAVGPGCPDLEFQLSAKATRGGAFNSDEGGVNGFARRFIPPYVRSNALGFRCGRTLPEGGGLCRSNQVSDLEEACRPRGVPLCAAPDFTSPADAEHCPGGARQDLANCATPLERYCTLDPLRCTGAPGVQPAPRHHRRRDRRRPHPQRWRDHHRAGVAVRGPGGGPAPTPGGQRHARPERRR
ncbi:MAG: formylglycine-generating enzyme family protein [Planctomycetota bacterium]|jgi:formylglycine-generating enzyme required for sulfatase activity